MKKDHKIMLAALSFPAAESLPLHGATCQTGTSASKGSSTRHDVLDRVLQTTIPDDTSTIFAYGFGKDRDNATRFHTTVTDAKNNSKETFKDVGEHITAVKEFNKGETIWTSYAYDPLGQIVQVKDDKDNLTTVSYDLMGRRTHIDSPDAGLTEYVFDPASNLVEKITANLRAAGKAIKYDYSYNRLDGIEYPDYTGNNVSYTYGEPGAAFNRADRIVTVTDESGGEERFYGPLGETVKTIKYVASKTEGKAANSPEIYVTEYTYDTYNRLRQLIYPDNELLTYSYNSGGLAESASGKKGDYDYPYLKALTYDKFEQRVFMRQGNGAETGYDYNPRNRRLANLKAAAAGREFMDLSYDYDPVGNILGLDNAAAVRKPYEFGGKSQQRFGYDDLYRLTSANGLLEQKPNTEYRYSLAMQYDSIHNIVRKDQEDIRIVPGGSAITQKKTTYDYTYAYTSSRPHAPTQIGERAFSYDANGNQTGWESDENGTRRTIVWDEENRIQEISDNGHTMRYVYNDAGERVIKTGPQGETVYVNQFYSVRNREVGSKHVFVGTGRIVTKLVKGQENVTTPGDVTHPGKSDPSGKAVGHSGKGNNGGGSGGGAPGKGNIVYEKDIYYYHPDHLGSSTFISDADGELYQHLENFPFGETWVEESTNTQRTPYHFTAKELDEETGLYFFGARYYDPRTSVWQSADPILISYLSGKGGAGGIYNSVNMGLYSYAHLNPVKLIDPDGREVTRDATISFSTLINNVRTWETAKYSGSNVPLNDRLGDLRNTIHNRAMFGSGGSGSAATKRGPSTTGQLGWHYIHTSKEGWIDLGHFSNAALYSNRFGETVTKIGGLLVEIGQFIASHIPFFATATKTSAGTREDLGSNRLGAEFSTFLKTYKGGSVADGMETFLKRYNPSESPSSAPDFNSLPGTQDELDSHGYMHNLGQAYKNMGSNIPNGLNTLWNRSNPE